jgi:general secretion pathway protein G
MMIDTLSRKQAARLMRRGQRGMTLLEIMIVIAILGMLASAVVYGVMGSFDRAKINTTKLKIKGLEGEMNKYKVSTGEYPAQNQGIGALLNPPDGGPSYLKDKKLPKDEWGNEFLYFSPGRNGQAFEIKSKGPDGQEGTEDDIGTKS